MTTARSASFIFVALLAIAVRADVRPSALFQDHAILQRDKPVPVWGSADPGEHVRVSFAGQTVTDAAGPDGKWRTDLAPLAASATPATLTIAPSGSRTSPTPAPFSPASRSPRAIPPPPRRAPAR